MAGRTHSDEYYILARCDEVLGRHAERQHRFPFLRGDARPGKQGVMLPVDAYYDDLKLVIEYREHQHTRSVPIMDRRMTVSGMCRRCQRRLYDQRRRDLLPANCVTLVEISYSDFPCDRHNRPLRNDEEVRRIIRSILSRYGLFEANA